MSDNDSFLHNMRVLVCGGGGPSGDGGAGGGAALISE